MPFIKTAFLCKDAGWLSHDTTMSQLFCSTGTDANGCNTYPPVIKRSLLENSQVWTIFHYNLSFSSGIFQLATLDCQKVFETHFENPKQQAAALVH